MQLQHYVEQVQSHLVASATLGDEATRHIASALATAAEPAVRLAVLAAASAAADEITAALVDAPGSPAVSVRLDGDELRVEVRTAEVPEEPAPAAQPEDADASARISLRLSEALKADIEVAARAATVSVNTWLVRAAGAALAGPPSGRGITRTEIRTAGAGGVHRITGWVNG
jgi:hypothetical protein